MLSATIQDGNPRTVTYVEDAGGQVIRRRETAGTGAASTGTILSDNRWYRFAGAELYESGSATVGADGIASAAYTIRDGDSLQSIALSLWGDGALWYKLAEANPGVTGITGPAAALTAGRTLVIPGGVTSTHHSADTFKPYDITEALGNTQPGAPAQPVGPAPPSKKGCGVIGAIILVAIAIAVAIALPYAIPALAPAALGGGVAGAALSGAIGAAAGSVVSQGFGVATGLQDKFSFKSVALAAIAGGIGGGLKGLGEVAKAATEAGKTLSTIGKVGQFLNKGGFVANAARGALSSALTQGVSVAAGLQKKFDWTGIAAAGVSAGVIGEVSSKLTAQGLSGTILSDGANKLVSGLAGDIVNAATRSLINGTDFGDNIIAALPDTLGQTIGNMLGGALVQGIAGGRTARAQARAAGASTSSALRLAVDYDNLPINAGSAALSLAELGVPLPSLGSTVSGAVRQAQLATTTQRSRSRVSSQAAASKIITKSGGNEFYPADGTSTLEAALLYGGSDSSRSLEFGKDFSKSLNDPRYNVDITTSRLKLEAGGNTDRLAAISNNLTVLHNQLQSSLGDAYNGNIGQVADNVWDLLPQEYRDMHQDIVVTGTRGHWSPPAVPSNAAIENQLAYDFGRLWTKAGERFPVPFISIPSTLAQNKYRLNSGEISASEYNWQQTLATLPGGAYLRLGTAIDAKSSKVPVAAERGAVGSAYATNGELVQSIATRADNWGMRNGMGNGPVVGTAKHIYSDRLLTRYQRMFGDRGLTAEARYVNGVEWQRGMPTSGSVRLDVVEGPLTRPTAVWDYKFGGATLSPSRVTQIQNGIPNGANVPVWMVKP